MEAETDKNIILLYPYHETRSVRADGGWHLAKLKLTLKVSAKIAQLGTLKALWPKGNLMGQIFVMALQRVVDLK